MQLPSSRVGIILIVVVLIVSTTMLSSFIDFKKPTKQPKLVELVIERNTASISGENWLDNLTYVNSIRPTESRFAFGDLKYDPDSMTTKATVDLMTDYFLLKQKGLITEEEKDEITRKVSEQIVNNMDLAPKFTKNDIKTTISNKDTVAIYGDRVAQETINHLVILDSFKKYEDIFMYSLQVSNQYKKYIEELQTISVPTVAEDIHVELLNNLQDTRIFFQSLISSNTDPLVVIAFIAQYQAKSQNEMDLYTSLARYFKNNGIIFETDSTIKFWNFYE
jgi:hypothetical protein